MGDESSETCEIHKRQAASYWGKEISAVGIYSNICTKLWRRRCQEDLRSKWKLSSSLKFSFQLARVSQLAQHVVGFIVRDSSICNTRRHYIMMAMTVQMLWTINRMCFCPRWLGTTKGWFHIKLVMLKLQSSAKLCWVSFGAVATRWKHCAFQWWPQGDLGAQWRVAFEEERTRLGLVWKWCYLLDH